MCVVFIKKFVFYWKTSMFGVLPQRKTGSLLCHSKALIMIWGMEANGLRAPELPSFCGSLCACSLWKPGAVRWSPSISGHRLSVQLPASPAVWTVPRHCGAATPLRFAWPMRFFQSVKVATLQREMSSKRWSPYPTRGFWKTKILKIQNYFLNHHSFVIN